MDQKVHGCQQTQPVVIYKDLPVYSQQQEQYRQQKGKIHESSWLQLAETFTE
jgi:hypothetical protein